MGRRPVKHCSFFMNVKFIKRVNIGTGTLSTTEEKRSEELQEMRTESDAEHWPEDPKEVIGVIRDVITLIRTESGAEHRLKDPKEAIDLIRGALTLYAALNALILIRRLYKEVLKEVLKKHNLTEEEFEKLPEEEQEKLFGGPAHCDCGCCCDP